MEKFGLWISWLLLFLSSLFMILLILVQRGRGGGITGALGGPGGQSAFGSKTGDVFTKITVYTAIIWILLSVFTIAFLNKPEAISPITEPPGKRTTVPGTGKIGGDAEEQPAETPSDKEAAPDAPSTDTKQDAGESGTSEAPKSDETKSDQPKSDATQDQPKTGEAAPATKDSNAEKDKSPGGG